MAPLTGVEESWFGGGGGGEERSASGESISVRISTKAQEVVKRQAAMAAGEPGSDGEEDVSGCCMFRGRSVSRKYSSGRTPNGGAFARLSNEGPESTKAKIKYQRSRSACATIFFCCGSREDRSGSYATVEVRAVDAVPKRDRKWEVDVNEVRKPPYWKQLVGKVKSQCRARHSSRSEWLNYDAHSYQMNFDDGCWQDDCASILYAGENDDSVARARTMQAALLKKFAAGGTQQDGSRSPVSPSLSPLPVKMMSKEEIEKSKEGFVPIWQRRQGAPPIKLDLRQRPGPLEG